MPVSADVGLLTSKLTFEGPLRRGSFLCLRAATYIDGVTWVLNEIIDWDPPEQRLHLPY